MITLYEVDKEATRLDLTRQEMLLALAYADMPEDDSFVLFLILKKVQSNAELDNIVDMDFPADIK